MVGKLVIVIGLLMVGYFAFFFDTSVEVSVQQFSGTRIGGRRVNNLGLMNEQQNFIIVGFGIAAVGALLAFLPTPRTSSEVEEQMCLYCRETIKVGAKICRYCHKELSE